MAENAPLLSPAPYVTISLAATITGLTQKAIRRKIEDGKWIEGREFRRSPDGGIFISIKGYMQWVEAAPGLRREKAVSVLNSSLTERLSESG